MDRQYEHDVECSADASVAVIVASNEQQYDVKLSEARTLATLDVAVARLSDPDVAYSALDRSSYCLGSCALTKLACADVVLGTDQRHRHISSLR